MNASSNRSARICALSCAALLVALPAGAQETPPGGELRGDSPRSAMRGYLEASRAGDFTRAANYLDLRALAPAQRAERGPELARHLKEVLDREIWVDLDALSDAPDGDADDGLRSGRDLVGTLEADRGKTVDVLLEHVPGGDPPHWRISGATVRAIPQLYAAYGPSPIETSLPPALVETRWLELALWQWIGVGLGILLAVGASYAIARLVLRVGWRVAKRTIPTLDPDAAAVLRGPLRLGVGVAIFGAALPLLALSVPAQGFLAGVAKGLAVVAITWLVLRLADGVAAHAEQRFRTEANLPAAAAVPLVRRIAKVILVLLAALAFADNLGADVTGLIAGLGIGGLAVALAAQKTMENLFGGLTLITDQPVRAGDFCRVGSWLGVIQDVGLRSTRIRTLDRTVVTIPNGALAGMELENFTRRDRIFFHPTLNLRYETTPDQLRWLLVAIKRLLIGHPMVDPAPARVRFVSLGASSLDLEIFAYVRTTDYDEFLAVQEDLLLRLIDLVEESGTGFAFPSQTIYTASDDGLDAERSRAAEEAVRAWREQSELPLPWLPQRRAEELRGKLDFPPKGAARDA